MGFYRGPNIVRDGLILLLDAGNIKSYNSHISDVEVLVVAGGGGGGGRSGGGGGAGGLVYNSSFQLLDSSYSVVVGDGGAGGAGSGGIGINGSDSVFSTITAYGGGGGAGDATLTGAIGGSGGGGKYGSVGSAGIAGQGYAGGSGYNNPYAGGGGGGAGGVGVNGTSSGEIGDGGPGLSYDISGTVTYYAGGGGGGSHIPANGLGYGGIGGGGNGGAPGGKNAGENGLPNTGGGGGAGSTDSGTGGAGGNGGSGVVIIRYVGGVAATGGIIFTSGGYTTHVFTSSDTFNVIWKDLSGNELHTTTTTPPVYSIDGSGIPYFLYTDGAHQYFQTIEDSPFSGNAFSMTVTAVINQSAFAAYKTILGQRPGNSLGGLSINSLSGYFGTDHWNPGGMKSANISELNRTYHVTWVIDTWATHQSTLKLYIDGVQVTTVPYSVDGTPTLLTGPFIIGNWDISRTDMDFAGRLYMIHVYNRALTQSEITQNFNAQKGRFGL